VIGWWRTNTLPQEEPSSINPSVGQSTRRRKGVLIDLPVRSITPLQV